MYIFFLYMQNCLSNGRKEGIKEIEMVTENADGRDGEIFDVVKMDGEK